MTAALVPLPPSLDLTASSTGITAPPAFYTLVLKEDSQSAAAIFDQWSSSEDADRHLRRPSLLARALVRKLLVEVTGLSGDGWQLAAEPSGRPLACHPKGATPSISMSHSGNWAAGAVSLSGEIGIDIEVHACHRDIAGIAAAAFGPEEQAAIAQGGVDGFYRIWTLREAFAKAVGRGLALATDRRDRFAADPGPEGSWAMIDGSRWWLEHRNPVANLSLAVALRVAGPQRE